MGLYNDKMFCYGEGNKFCTDGQDATQLLQLFEMCPPPTESSEAALFA